jgi:hypothetical protein
MSKNIVTRGELAAMGVPAAWIESKFKGRGSITVEKLAQSAPRSAKRIFEKIGYKGEVVFVDDGEKEGEEENIDEGVAVGSYSWKEPIRYLAPTYQAHDISVIGASTNGEIPPGETYSISICAHHARSFQPIRGYWYGVSLGAQSTLLARFGDIQLPTLSSPEINDGVAWWPISRSSLEPLDLMLPSINPGGYLDVQLLNPNHFPTMGFVTIWGIMGN